MTFAWYGHLKYKGSALWIVILVSWGIALLEYCFQVPANRIGHEYFTAAQLKTMQEVITLIVFSIFSILYLKEELASYGLDLKYYVTSRGETYEPGKLYKAEIALLMKKADEMIVFLTTLKRRKDKIAVEE